MMFYSEFREQEIAINFFNGIGQYISKQFAALFYNYLFLSSGDHLSNICLLTKWFALLSHNGLCFSCFLIFAFLFFSSYSYKNVKPMLC